MYWTCADHPVQSRCCSFFPKSMSVSGLSQLLAPLSHLSEYWCTRISHVSRSSKTPWLSVNMTPSRPAYPELVLSCNALWWKYLTWWLSPSGRIDWCPWQSVHDYFRQWLRDFEFNCLGLVQFLALYFQQCNLQFLGPKSL